MADVEYGIVRHVAAGYEEAVNLAREALKEQGFGVLTEIVEAVSPLAALSVVDNALLSEVAQEAQRRLLAAVEAVKERAEA
jgi:hypothetical protein